MTRRNKVSLAVTSLPLALLVALIACDQRQAGVDDSKAAGLGGQQSTPTLLDYYVRQAAKGPAGNLDAVTLQALKQDLEKLQAAARVAEADPDPDIHNSVELQRLELLARSGAAKAGVFDEPTDAEVLAAYDAFVAGRPASEYHVAHILVPMENAALGVIRRLAEGADFAELARQESADDSRIRGGDIGWVYPGKLPAEFTAACESLEPGQYTAVPVRTAYGWHVIKLLETRAAAAPPLEQVRAQIVANLKQERYQQYLTKVWLEQKQ